MEPFVTQEGVFLMSQILSEMEKGGSHSCLVLQVTVLWSLNLMLFGEPGSVTPGPWGCYTGQIWRPQSTSSAVMPFSSVLIWAMPLFYTKSVV